MFNLIQFIAGRRTIRVRTLSLWLFVACVSVVEAHASPVVSVTALNSVQWRAQAQLSASLVASQNATLAPARGGVVTAVNFQSGQSVQKGDVLVVLDVGPEQAQLALDRAKLVEARQSLVRAQKLALIAGTSRAALEQAQADEAEAQAQLKSDIATLQQGEVIAPFSGIVGIRKLDPGDYIQAGQSVTSLAAPGRLKLYFAIPQAQAYNIQPGASLIFTAPLGSGINVSAEGTLTALSPVLDSSTDAWEAEGLLNQITPNLRSGMNGVVSIATGPSFKAFAVPNTALNDSMLGPYILVVNKQQGADVVQSIYVKILSNAGTTSVITGPDLKAGETIVAVGGFKLTSGQPVSINNS